MTSPSQTIDDVCLQIVDCEHKTAPIDPAGDYFAVGTPAMRGNSINYAESRRISKETFEKWTRRLAPKEGDLLFAREAPVGPIIRIPDAGNVAPGQRTMLLRPNPSVVDSNFLYYLLTSPLQQERLLSLTTGSTVAHLNVADVRAFHLPALPSVEQQRAIAEVLGALDDKIAANTKLAATSGQLAEAQFYQLMADAVDVAVLGDIISLDYGKTLPTGSRIPGPVDVFGSGGVTGSHNEALCPKPGVVVGRKGTAGAVHWSHKPFFPIDTTFYVTPKREEISQIFSYFLLRTLRLDEMNNDSAVPGLNRNEAHAAKLRLPSEAALRAFTTLATELFDVTAQREAENRALAATRDTLLPQLMSGKLRVKDAEAVLENAGV